MIELGQHPKGVLLCVRAQPRARQARIVGEHGGALKVAVTDAPEKGKANQAIIDVLCDQLGLKRSQVMLIAGETSRDKRFLIAGQNDATLRSKLERLTVGIQS